MKKKCLESELKPKKEVAKKVQKRVQIIKTISLDDKYTYTYKHPCYDLTLFCKGNMPSAAL
jgi:hypothetical protein